MRIKVTVPVDLTTYPKLTFNGLFYFIADSCGSSRSKPRCRRTSDQLFNRPFPPVLGLGALSTICYGEIRFQTDAQRILVIGRLSFIDTVLLASLLVGLLAYCNYRIFLLGRDDLIFYLVAWFGMIAGIVIDSLARWRRFIRHCIREAADRVYLTKEDLLAARPDGPLAS